MDSRGEFMKKPDGRPTGSIFRRVSQPKIGRIGSLRVFWQLSVIAVFPLKTGDSMFVGFDSQNTSCSVVFCQELFEFRRIERARDSKHASRAIGVADVDKDMLHAAFLINDGTRGVETVGD